MVFDQVPASIKVNDGNYSVADIRKVLKQQEKAVTDFLKGEFKSPVVRYNDMPRFNASDTQEIHDITPES